MDMQRTHTPNTATDRGLVALVVVVMLLALTCTLLTWMNGRTAGGWTGTAGTAGATSVDMSTTSTPAFRPLGDGVADHGLFNENAELDTSRIDDLRTDPYGQCVASDGVLTPTGACVDGVRVWQDEMSIGTWNALRAQGYELGDKDPTSMWIPAEYVILGGPHGEDVLAVDLSRPLTPR